MLHTDRCHTASGAIRMIAAGLASYGYFRGDQFRSFMVGIEDASLDGQVIWHVKFVNVYVKLHESTDEGECWVHVALLSLLWRSHRSPQRRKLY
jgi:hypothetical protein